MLILWTSVPQVAERAKEDQECVPLEFFFSLWCVRGLLLVVPACPGLLPLRRAPLVAGEGRPTLWSLVLFEWSRRWIDQNSEQRKKTGGAVMTSKLENKFESRSREKAGSGGQFGSHKRGAE